jgi:autotransporter-associated beta strand protein
MERIRRQRTAVLFAATATVAVTPFAVADPPSGSANNRLVFADEFNGTSLDTSKWSAASPSWTMPNSASTATASDVTEANGMLTLSANRTSASAFDSGSISSYTKYNFAGGYVEARIQLPTTVGSWPAFWGLYSGWPPEADIMEYPLTTDGGTDGLNANQYNTNYHYTNSSGSAAAGAGVVTAGSSLAGTWHTFGMDWTSATSVTFYLDGTRVQSYTGSSVSQMASMYMILDYAVGGWPGTPSTSQWAIGHSDQVNVDYVRIWQANPKADAADGWNVNGNGSFTTGGNWTLGAVPQYGNEVAVFGRVGTAATSAVTLGAWQMFGGMTFNGASGATTAYTIGTSSNNVQLAGTATTSTVSVLASSTSTVSQTINANVELWSNVNFENDMTTAGQTLNVNGLLTGAGTLTAVGVGTTILSHANNTYAGGTVIGTAAGAAVLQVQASGALGTGTVTFDTTGNGSTAELQLNGSSGGITLANPITAPQRNNTTVAIENIAGTNTLSGLVSLVTGGSQFAVQSDAGLLTLSGGVTSTAGTSVRTLALQGSGNGVVSGVITGGTAGVGVVKSGTGTWTLSAANTYAGTTTVTGGKLLLAHSAATPTSAISISAGATLAPLGTLTTSGALASAGAVDMTGDGGTTNLSVGSLSLNAATLDLQLGTAAASDRVVSTGPATLSGVTTVNLSAAAGQSITSGTAYTIVTAASGLSAGNFALGTKPASLNFMQFVLSTPTAGTLLATATGNPTPATAYWTDAGSAATGDTTNSWGAGASVNTSNWSTDPAGTVDPKQLPGSITSVVLNAADAPATAATSTTQLDSAYAIAGLTFNVTPATVTSAVLNTNGNPLSIGSGGLTLSATSNAAATVNGGGAITLTTNQAWANQNNSAALTIATGVTSGTGSATLTFNGTGTGGVNLTGVLADGGGPLSVYFNQAGTTLLTASNTYTGATTVAGGTVEIASTGSVAGGVAVTGGTLRLTDSPNAIAPTATVAMGAAGTLDVRSATPGTPATANLGMLVGGGTLTRSTPGTSTVSVGATGLTGTFSGSIQNGSGTLALIKRGAGTLALSGSSSYTGGTQIYGGGGTLQVSNANALGAGPVTIGQGGANDSGELQLAGNISLAGVTTINLDSRDTSNTDGTAHIENVGGNNTVAANLNINGTGGSTANILSTSGTLTLTGLLSSTGLTSARGFDFYGAGNGVVSGVIANGTAQTTFVQKDGTGTWTLSGNNTYTDSTTLNGGTLNVTGNNNWGGGALGVNDGTAVLSGTNVFTGGTYINGTSTVAGGSTTTGGRVVMAGPAALGVAGSGVTMSGNATLEIDTDGGDNQYALHVGTTNTVNLVSGVKTGTAGINHTLASLAVGNADTVNVSAAANVSGGNPAITIGAVTLSSGYGAGSTTFNPTTANLTLGTVNTSTSGAKDLILAGTSTGNLVTGVVSNNAAVVSVEKSGTSTWTLSGNNTFTGGSLIDDGGGTLLVTNGNALGTAALTIGNGASNASGELALSGGITLAVPTINFESRLVSTGGGTADIENVSGNNTISAALNISNTGGSYVNILSTAGTLTLTGAMSSTGLTSARGFNLDGPGNGVATGIISDGTAQVTLVQKSGTGKWTLSGANSYTGGTAIADGTLVINGTQTGTGGTMVGTSTAHTAVLAGTGNLAGAVTVNGQITAGSGATAADSVGTLTTGAETWNANAGLTAKLSANGASNDTLVVGGLSLGTATAANPFTVTLLATGPTTAAASPLILVRDTTLGDAGVFTNAIAAATLTLSTSSTVTGPSGGGLSLTEVDNANGVYLEAVAATPEPTSLLLLAGMVAPLTLSRRRRRGGASH